MIEPIATTVAGDDPEIAANSAQAITPARPRPPYQCPTIEVANAIMRRATPPWVRKLPARMKNGIAMISKFSMPVNSFSATASIGTCVIVNRKVSTVRPSAIETGMPVSISTISSPKMMAEVIARPRRGGASAGCSAGASTSMPSTRLSSWCGSCAGPPERPGHLQEAEAHQVGAGRHGRNTIQRGASRSADT